MYAKDIIAAIKVSIAQYKEAIALIKVHIAAYKDTIALALVYIAAYKDAISLTSVCIAAGIGIDAIGVTAIQWLLGSIFSPVIAI